MQAATRGRQPGIKIGKQKYLAGSLQGIFECATTSCWAI